MSFSQSTFTLDIDGQPTLILRTKWRVSAEDYCRAWAEAHQDELATKGPYGSDLPLISRAAITLRMARAVEKAAKKTACAERDEVVKWSQEIKSANNGCSR